MNGQKEKLAWYKLDPESKWGFKCGKFTSVNLAFSLILGVIFGIVFYGILFPFHGKGYQMIDMFFHGGEQARSSIPYYTVFFTAWSLAILLIKNLKLRVQKKALELNIIPSGGYILTKTTAPQILNSIHAQAEDPENFILLDRIERALSNLENLGNVSAVSECFKNQADNDNDFLSATYTVLKGFVWAIPVLGFIGTVVGLSDSVGGFGSVVKESSDIEKIKAALGGVTGGLGTAFETTLIALVLAMIVQLIMTFTMNKEEYFLDACADYCHKNIISRMKSETSKDMEEH